MRSWAIFGGSVILAGFAAVAGMHVRAEFFPETEVLPGLTVEHRAIVGSVAATIADAARDRLSERARFQIDGDVVIDASLADLGVTIDEARTADIAREIGHEGDLSSRADLAKRAARGEIDVPLVARID